jgi:hypothetical protein
MYVYQKHIVRRIFLTFFSFFFFWIIADLLDAARNGDAAGVERAAEKLAALQPKLIRTARSAADTLSDPNRKKKLFGAIDELGILPVLLFVFFHSHFLQAALTINNPMTFCHPWWLLRVT